MTSFRYYFLKCFLSPSIYWSGASFFLFLPLTVILLFHAEKVQFLFWLLICFFNKIMQSCCKLHQVVKGLLLSECFANTPVTVCLKCQQKQRETSTEVTSEKEGCSVHQRPDISTVKTTEMGLFPYWCSPAAESVSSCRCRYELRARARQRRKLSVTYCNLPFYKLQNRVMMLWNRSLRLRKAGLDRNITQASLLQNFSQPWKGWCPQWLSKSGQTGRISQVHLGTEFSFAGAHPWNLCWEMSDSSKFIFLTPICTPTMYRTPWGVDRVQWWTEARSLNFTSTAER